MQADDLISNPMLDLAPGLQLFWTGPTFNATFSSHYDWEQQLGLNALLTWDQKDGRAFLAQWVRSPDGMESFSLGYSIRL